MNDTKDEAIHDESAAPDDAQAQSVEQGEDLNVKLQESEKAVAMYKDQLLRKAAEFENYKKRVESDFLDRIRFANESIIEALLPVLDDLERSLKMSESTKDYETLMTGVRLIQAKLFKTLQSKGLKTYEAVGKPFDTAFHDALMQMPRGDVPPNTVVEEVEKGYILNDKVLRHAKVIVASQPVSGDADGSDQSQPN